jgi:hypothetical protein
MHAQEGPDTRLQGRAPGPGLDRDGKTIAIAEGDAQWQRAVLRFRGAGGLRSTYTVTLVLVDAAGVGRRRVKAGVAMSVI